RGEPAADHHDRQADLEVGDRLALRGSGELKRHQEVGSRAYAAREAVRDLEHGGAARAGAQGDMVEAHAAGSLAAERLVDVERAAEAHAAEHGELAPPLEQQADDLEEVLVPAHRDAVLGDAAEPGHDALAEVFLQLLDVLDGSEWNPVAERVDTGDLGRERLD